VELRDARRSRRRKSSFDRFRPRLCAGQVNDRAVAPGEAVDLRENVEENGIR
jgi:hypothetical protein